MRVRASVKRLCPKCKIVKRGKRNRSGGKRVYVVCTKKRHKQRQG